VRTVPDDAHLVSSECLPRRDRTTLHGVLDSFQFLVVRRSLFSAEPERVIWLSWPGAYMVDGVPRFRRHLDASGRKPGKVQSSNQGARPGPKGKALACRVEGLFDAIMGGVLSSA
jgi:hypothetical protein